MPEIFPTAVYSLCFATSGACAFLLARRYLQTGIRVLLWSAICFVLLAGNNFMVILDLLVLPDINLGVIRLAFSAAGLGVLLFGFVWDLKE
ncbi:MAG: DUF5985 family protein [Sphingomonas sp.]|jgi:hypothetical protein|uniref:DUF5985 family protein n=1 Tax=Sphingomonas sp. TaxID=28214 RepID=UPI00356810CF